MKSKILIVFIFLLVWSYSEAQDKGRNCRNWIIPKYLNLQYSGGVGNYVIGAGYILNQAQSLRLIFQYGFTPKYKAENTLHTSGIKFSYYPVQLKLFNDFSIIPDVSLGISKVFSDGPGTFTRLPSYYPDGYYAPNAFRFHFNLGGVFRYDLDPKHFIKAIELYIETTTNDLYVSYYFKYEPIKITDIFSMAIGVNIIMGRW